MVSILEKDMAKAEVIEEVMRMQMNMRRKDGVDIGDNRW